MASAASTSSSSSTACDRLVAERAAATFNPKVLTHFIDGGERVTRRKEAMRIVVESEPVFDNVARLQYNHKQQYEAAMRKVRRSVELKTQLNLNAEDFQYMQLAMQDSLPTFLHEIAFLPTLRQQLTPEQQKKWLPAAEAYAIIGCYAQTELGHGSNLDALETTATFIPETDEIELDTPTITATKWWPGCMGRTATHAIVYAHLRIPDGSGGYKKLGLHGFILQMRSLEDHTLMPGVLAGDIGSKLGGNSIDNGFMRLNRVRVPRDNMLMRFQQLSRDGKYTKKGHKKSLYGTMVYIRAALVVSSASNLAKAATIATRYGVVRKQFSHRKFGAKKIVGETSILDYQLYNRRIMPVLAQTYALFATGRFMMTMYHKFQKQLNTSQDFSLLPELHAASAGLKSLCTAMAADGIEVCRRAEGGHGYSMASGLGELYTTYVGTCTAEGDNYLMTLQTARYLIKSLHKSTTSGKVPQTAQYLTRVMDLSADTCSASTKEGMLQPQVLLDAMGHRAAAQVSRAARGIASVVEKGGSVMEAFTSNQWALSQASNAHCLNILATSLDLYVKDLQSVDAAIASVMRLVCNLFTLHQLEQGAVELIECGYLSPKQFGWIRDLTDEAVEAVRAHAVPLTDAFNLSDKMLNSAIGGYDGKAFETLFKWAVTDPMNAERVTPAYKESIKPLLDLNKHLRAKL